MEESTNNQPLISVVVPSFNHRQFIGKTIETICNQSYEKIQLIIIDDGSTDGSVEYINKLKGKYKNIIEDFVFISQSNIGLTKTLNRALFEYVNGDYITIVASDDYLLEDSLKLRFECLKNTSSDVVFSECIRVDELNNFVGSILFTKERYISLVDLSVRSNFLPAPSAFMKTAVLRKIGGYDESLWFEDLDMWFCLLKSNYKLFFLKKELVLSLIHI
ncbi:hypothetical protein CTM93_19440 [Photobacterium phosphoreum]|uniref:glycosyltransferase n=1 Tax=Photobacterium phosphoreum TaxID=659 RepID=UPI000D18295A|nr:glycosyltransferase [Photobacterium phosphoreum]PSU76477.1 hypothetical protein CTM93_19440 [Photobacterium phosphoreum]